MCIFSIALGCKSTAIRFSKQVFVQVHMLKLCCSFEFPGRLAIIGNCMALQAFYAPAGDTEMAGALLLDAQCCSVRS